MFLKKISVLFLFLFLTGCAAEYKYTCNELAGVLNDKPLKLYVSPCAMPGKSVKKKNEELNSFMMSCLKKLLGVKGYNLKEEGFAPPHLSWSASVLSYQNEGSFLRKDMVRFLKEKAAQSNDTNSLFMGVYILNMKWDYPQLDFMRLLSVDLGYVIYDAQAQKVVKIHEIPMLQRKKCVVDVKRDYHGDFVTITTTYEIIESEAEQIRRVVAETLDDMPYRNTPVQDAAEVVLEPGKVPVVAEAYFYDVPFDVDDYFLKCMAGAVQSHGYQILEFIEHSSYSRLSWQVDRKYSLFFTVRPSDDKSKVRVELSASDPATTKHVFDGYRELTAGDDIAGKEKLKKAIEDLTAEFHKSVNGNK